MSIQLRLYNALVNRVPSIQRRYWAIRSKQHGRIGRIYAWSALLFMNLRWLFGFRGFSRQELYPDYNKKLPDKPESHLLEKMEPQKLAKTLLDADVISFDIFDTLIFRPFSEPSDLFYLVGDKLGYLDFESLRREAEQKARQRAWEERKSWEVTLCEIYTELEKRTGIPRQLGMETEIGLELSCCYGNPYMLEVFQYLEKSRQNATNNPCIICVSDMYLPQEVVWKLLKGCGFQNIEAVFLSCEYGVSKKDGLYEKVKAQYGKNLRYIHIGDNPAADVQGAKRAGWRSIYYPNVQQAGKKYRAEDLSVIMGSIYRGIVNARIYGGGQYSKDFELGYIYGGMFVLGYCQFIHRYITEHPMDKLLFLSRDGYILHQIYTRLYPDEREHCAYVYWSRTVAARLSAGFYKEDYFRRFIHHKINQNITMEHVFGSAGLRHLLKGMSEELPQLTAYTVLTQHNEGMVKQYLERHWDEVLAHYAQQSEAARRYYSSILSGCQKAVTIDVGWAGSGSLLLQHIVRHDWNLDCQIYGLLAGTNTLNNAEPHMSEPELFSGRLTSYLYSQEHNREIWKMHHPGKNHNLLLEMLLSSPEGTLTGFELYNNTPEGYRLCFAKTDLSPSRVKEIHNGISTFVEDYLQRVPEEYVHSHLISGSDSYHILEIFLHSRSEVSLKKGI